MASLGLILLFKTLRTFKEGGEGKGLGLGVWVLVTDESSDMLHILCF